MNLHTLLQERAAEILAEAEEAIARARLRSYANAGQESTHQRLKALFVLTTRATKERNLGPMIAHADAIAHERFEAGYDLWEVQTAFNVLEEAIWVRVLKELPPAEYAEALGCTRLNCLAGIATGNADKALETLVENLRFAAAVTQRAGISERSHQRAFGEGDSNG